MTRAHYLPMISGDEVDALSRKSRRILKAFDRAGVAHKAKRSYARRIRQDGKREAKQGSAGVQVWR